ncbi:Rpn family recombination-promoting nuclease/putative transposase [Neobacillus sp. Marseille-QA0830]
MEKEYLDLKLDFMFKQLFGQKNCKHITLAFLNDLLGRKGDDRLTDLHFEHTENVKDKSDESTVIFDATVFTSLGERINIEIQLINQQNMAERTLYYWSRVFSSSLHSGDSYLDLPPTIIIPILNFPLFSIETERFHTVFHIREDKEGFLWSDLLEIHFIDLSKFKVQWKKFRRKLKEENHQELPWLMMLSAADVQWKKLDEEMFAELEERATNMEEVREALIEWENLSSKKKNQVEYEARLKDLRDLLNNYKGYHRMGKEEGIEEGIHEGIQIGLQKVAKKMLDKGDPISEIVEVTGLTEGEIRNL